jgi:hypothetical protein
MTYAATYIAALLLVRHLLELVMLV